MTPRINAADVFGSTGPAVDLDGIRRMLDGCGTSNRNDLLVIAIASLIDAGVNTGPRIIGAAVSIGFNRGHAGAVLSSSEGADPSRHQWQREADGVYRLHPAALAA